MPPPAAPETVGGRAARFLEVTGRAGRRRVPAGSVPWESPETLGPVVICLAGSAHRPRPLGRSPVRAAGGWRGSAHPRTGRGPRTRYGPHGRTGPDPDLGRVLLSLLRSGTAGSPTPPPTPVRRPARPGRRMAPATRPPRPGPRSAPEGGSSSDLPPVFALPGSRPRSLERAREVRRLRRRRRRSPKYRF